MERFSIKYKYIFIASEKIGSEKKYIFALYRYIIGGTIVKYMWRYLKICNGKKHRNELAKYRKSLGIFQDITSKTLECCSSSLELDPLNLQLLRGGWWNWWFVKEEEKKKKKHRSKHARHVFAKVYMPRILKAFWMRTISWKKGLFSV